MRVTPHDLGAPNGTRWVHAACGRNHTLLVGSDGSLWSAGANSYGQVSIRVSVVFFHCVVLIMACCSVDTQCAPRLERLSR